MVEWVKLYQSCHFGLFAIYFCSHMKQFFGCILISLTFFTFCAHAQQPIRMILDTDMDSDVDDAGALAMLHTLMDHQIIDLLGIIVTSDDPFAPSCTDAINHYRMHENGPMKVVDDKLHPSKEIYTYWATSASKIIIGEMFSK